MKTSTPNWIGITPLVFVGAVLIFLAVLRSMHTTQPWTLPLLVVALPILLSTSLFMVVVASLRKKKSRRTWDLMVNADPEAIHFLVFVYPGLRIQLERLGWRLYGPAYLSVPAIGLSIGVSKMHFWEAGTEQPTLTLSSLQIREATAGLVSDGYLSHTAIILELNTPGRSNKLKLTLRGWNHRRISSASLSGAIASIHALQIAP